MSGPILRELKHHAPFTLLGAFSGILLMVLFHNIPYKESYNAFYVFHPVHVLLSALTTATMYKNYKCASDSAKCNISALLAIGFFGSIGIATLSDSVVPYIGEVLLGLKHAEPHIGFLEKPWLIVSLAATGTAIAYFNPSTKFPHAGHVFISTWASLFHVLMAIGKVEDMFFYMGIFVFLFLAVWLPCCVSDIVFPLLFVGSDAKKHKH